MADAPWQGDACSLVDAFRSGERSPLEELEATLAAVDASTLNAFVHVDRDGARGAAAGADTSLPFGGVPVGIKVLEPVTGWPWTEASVVFAGRRAPHTSHHVARLVGRGGAVPVGATAASEFGGLNVSVSKLYGVTHNPWQRGRTAGGSSGGSAAAVAGGLVTLATGGDGGGSIRIPAGYCGLLGMKGTFGRIPRSPHAWARPNTVVLGALARSTRDVARYYDVCAGVHPHDPTSLPSPGGWEAGLGSRDLRGLRVAVIPALGGAPLEAGMEQVVRERAAALIAEAGMIEVPLRVEPPNLAAEWMMGNMATLLAELGDLWPGCAGDLTAEIALGLRLSQSLYNLRTAAVAETLRLQANEAMAGAFESVDLIMAATNPGPAFAATASTATGGTALADRALANPAAVRVVALALVAARFAGAGAPRLPSALVRAAAQRLPDLVTMGALTIISNVYGNPAVSIPAGTIGGLPVGLQVLGRHHHDALLLDVAALAERVMPWPLVAPVAA